MVDKDLTHYFNIPVFKHSNNPILLNLKGKVQFISLLI